jgi:hypothetical protein
MDVFGQSVSFFYFIGGRNMVSSVTANTYYQNYMCGQGKTEISSFHQTLLASLEETPSSVISSIGPRIRAPYSHLADANGIINYNGVIFECDPRNILLLGCAAEDRSALNIPLSNGGVIKVNRGMFGELAKAIDMFSPEDRNHILRALAQEAKIGTVEEEIAKEEEEHEKRLDGEEEQVEAENKMLAAFAEFSKSWELANNLKNIIT